MARKFTFYTFLIFCVCFLSLQAQAQNCGISPFVGVSSPAPGSTICADDPLVLSIPPAGVFFGGVPATAEVIWGMYLGAPTSTDPDNDDSLLAYLSDNQLNVIYGGGTSTIANTNLFLTAGYINSVSLEIYIVPIINLDDTGIDINPNCSGVAIGSGDAFTVLNPYLNPDACNDACEGNIVSYNECENAENLQLGTLNGNYNNTCTTSDNLASDCFADDALGFLSTAWFTFEGDGGAYDISVLNSDNSTNQELGNNIQVIFYSGNCNGLNELDCAAAINNTAMLNTLNSEAGTIYYVMVDGFEENRGGFCIDIQNVTPPECTPNAGTISVNNGNQIFVGDDIVVEVSDNATGDYTNTTIFVNADNEIISSPTAIGTYTAVSINFSNVDAEIVNELLTNSLTFPIDFSTASCEPNTASVTFAILDIVVECTPNAGTITINDGNQICEGDEIVISIVGNATDGYSTITFFIDQTNTIVDTPTAIGVYVATTINFADVDTDYITQLLAIGNSFPTDFAEATCEPATSNDTFTINDCSVECLPNSGITTVNNGSTLCEGDEIVVAVSGDATGDYVTIVAVADETNTIIDANAIFAAGNYTILTVNFAIAESDNVVPFLVTGLALPTNFNTTDCPVVSDTQTITVFSADSPECGGIVCEPSVTFIEANNPLTICPTETTGMISVISNSSAEYSSSLIITEMGSDTIEGVAVSGSSISPSTFNLAAGTYCVHPINYLSSDWAVIDAIIGNSASLNDVLSAIDNGEICGSLDTQLCVSVTVLDTNNSACLAPLQVENVEIVAAADNLTYTVSFTIVGGTGNYTVDNGAITGNTFTSETLPCGTFYGFSVSDDANSSVVIIEGTSPCDVICTSDAGTMTGGSQFVCNGDIISFANNGDEIIAENEMLSYFLHTDENDVFGSNLGNNASGTFDISSLNENVEYYVSAVVGITDENGDIILEHPCTVASINADSFVKLVPITVTIDENCDFLTGIYTIVAQFDGGLPAFDTTATYDVDGDFTGDFFAGEETTVLIEEGETNIYQMTVSDGLCETVTISNEFYCEKTPIELISFTGDVQVRGNLLKWATASELDNDYFTIERSTDGHNFEAITFVSAEGSSLTTLYYEFLDKKAPNGVSYYRLLQTDFDGKTTVSGTITLRRNETGFSFNDIYPVPANDFVEVSFNVVEDVNTQIQIFNLAGSLVATYEESATKGTNAMTIDVSNYSSGVYFVTVNIGTDVISGRLIKN